MMVRYQWSEDGETEFCEREDIICEEAASCYQCDLVIGANEPAVRLLATDGDVYMLHTACAERGIIKTFL